MTDEELAALQAELAKVQYAGLSDQAISNLANAPGAITVPRGLVTPQVLMGDLADAVFGLNALALDTAVPAGLPAYATVSWMIACKLDITRMNPINMGTIGETTGTQGFLQIMAAYGLLGTTSDAIAAKISDVSTKKISVAESILGRLSTNGDVSFALRGVR